MQSSNSDNLNYDPLDPYDSYRFKDQSSNISETSIAKTKTISKKKFIFLKLSLVIITMFLALVGFYFFMR
jgi:hypothetical protein